jgi:uncharacterized protein YndB with AHSA1/START domain
MESVIEKQIEIRAPQSRVWQALTDYRQFSQWFRVHLEGPFIAGQTTYGQNAWPNYEHLRLEFAVKEIVPESYFSLNWHPFPLDPKRDYSQETPTLVEFKLSPTANGTLLVVVESGFDRIPADRYADAFRANSGGWTQQLNNIEEYVRTA